MCGRCKMFFIRREYARRHRRTCQNRLLKDFETLAMSLRDRRTPAQKRRETLILLGLPVYSMQADRRISTTSASTAARIFHLPRRSATTNEDVIPARSNQIKDPEGGLTLEGPLNLRPMHLGATATSKLYNTMMIEI